MANQIYTSTTVGRKLEIGLASLMSGGRMRFLPRTGAGRAGQGTARQGRDQEGNRHRAVLLLRPEPLSSPALLSRQDDLLSKALYCHPQRHTPSLVNNISGQ